MEKQIKKVICAVCNKEFEKEKRRIKQTEKLGKKHTCSRHCASRLTNDQRIAPPTTANAKHTRRDKEKNPAKAKARQLVRQAIKSGKLIPLATCEYCYIKCKTEGHHPDHSQPFLLVWLCKSCHAIFDKHKIFGFGKDYSEEVGYNEKSN